MPDGPGCRAAHRAPQAGLAPQGGSIPIAGKRVRGCGSLLVVPVYRAMLAVKGLLRMNGGPVLPVGRPAPLIAQSPLTAVRAPVRG